MTFVLGFPRRFVRATGLAPTIAVVLACSDRSIAGGEGASSEGTSSEGTSSTADTTDASGTTDTGGMSQDCQPILQDDGTPTGFEACTSDDSVVRTSSVTCSDPYPPSDGVTCQAGYGVCSSDDDCTDAPFGSCGYVADITAQCQCEYGCVTDADCGSGQVCMCAPLHHGTRCIDADCQSDADCDQGYRCTLSLADGGWLEAWPSVRCHSAADECQADVDCPDGLCLWKSSGWECI
jgi:hypothetical protein